ncbi:unnamed protein product [Meloidogyne enterolobii]|uniref:Uncharacterized protein n=1 Tax=Meloidogyne enterolobii TaxID=390850 RepID=A0ACB0ZLT4_MELEN
MTKRFRDEQCSDRFRAGLLPEIKEKVIFMDQPPTLSMAVAQARRVEELNNTMKDDIWRRTKEKEVKATLAEVSEIRANGNREGTTYDKNRQNRQFGNRQNFNNRGWGNRGNSSGEWRRGQSNRAPAWNQTYRGTDNFRNFRNARGNRWPTGQNRNPSTVPITNTRETNFRGRGNFSRGGYRVSETSFPYIYVHFNDNMHFNANDERSIPNM